MAHFKERTTPHVSPQRVGFARVREDVRAGNEESGLLPRPELP